MATCADLLDADLPTDAAEDSFSFLEALLGRQETPPRTNVVSHSNNGEFAYREGAWKIVFKMRGRNLQQSRGQETVVELYNLESDPAEQHNVAETRPELVDRLTNALQRLVDRGTSRSGSPQANDTAVRFDVTQSKRWTAATE
jgi:arylsulfatase A-like enzyme